MKHRDAEYLQACGYFKAKGATYTLTHKFSTGDPIATQFLNEAKKVIGYYWYNLKIQGEFSEPREPELLRGKYEMEDLI